ncbi:Thymus-specific serine protease, partial [Linnemannia zychae]
GPIILWLPGESPLHSLFLRRGLAYELANATAGLLVALEHRFYGNSIPRFQDSPASLKKPIVFDTSHENQGSSSSSAPSSLSDVMLSEPEYSVRHMMVPPAATEEEELQRGAGGREEDRSVCMTDPLLSSSSTSSNSGSTKFHYQIGVDKTSHTRIKGHKHKIAKGGKHQPHDSNNQTDKNNGNHTNNDHNNNSDSTTGGEKEGLPLDLLKYLNVDQSIEDIARFMDLFPSLQPKLFPVSESNGGTLATNAPTKPRWILAGCSYGGNLAAWTRQRYPSKVFAAFASSAPVRSALDFFEYSTSQIDILGDKCSSQLGFARDFLDGALEMTDEFMQQMVVEELEVKQGNTKGLDNSGDLTSAATIVQEQGQLDEDASSNVYYPSSLPLPLAAMRNPAIAVDNSNDDKARRQAAKLRVLSWFSPDFAREYAAEGEEIHAAGWVWWTVASAVQYNAVVTPITVQPAKTAVDILCDAMDLAKVDDILENGTSSPSINNSSDQSQLKSLRYTKALAAWFKDQQYFTPTKQEDLQPSDLDPTSVQNLAGMAWLWQTCSELGYLQTAHPSTCCCPSLARVPSPVQSFNYQRFNRTCYEQGSKLFNNTCPFTSEEDKALQKETIYPADTITSESSYLEQPPTSKPTTTTTTTTTTTGTITAAAEATGTGAGPTCLPCRCYANEAQRSESVFSRLLTLEAAWQECQFYFSSTHPPAKNPVTKSSPSSLSSPISSVLETREGTFGNISRQQPPASSVNVGITSPSGQEQQSKPNSSDNHQVVTPDTNAGTTTQQQQKHDTTSTTTGKRDEVLLMGYPDVETNVNTKFHGWEIAQDPCYPTASASDRETSFDSGGNGSRTGDGVGDNYPQSGEIHFISPSTTTGSGEPSSWHAGGPESESIIDFSGGREVVEQTENEENDDEDDGEDNAMEAQGGLPHIASELDDWLLDHPGGRYYFTNGEKDPWKELTLASSRALEFLSRPKAGRGSINNSKNFAGTDDKRRGMNRANTKKDYSTVQDREFQESEEALEPARPFDAEEIREHQVTGKELPSVDATFGMRKSHYPTHHHHHHRHHRRHKHHRRRHHPNKHHHHLKHHQLHRTHRHKPKHQSLFHPPCTTSTIDPCTPLPLPTRNSRGVTTTRLPRPKQSDQDEDDVAGDTSGPTVVVVDDGDEDEEKNDGSLDDRGGSINNNGNGGRILKEDEYGDRTVVRIISDASHCQDILYESSDQHSIKLRAEREHVLKTFVRWIEIDNRRQQRVSERRQQRQQQ